MCQDLRFSALEGENIFPTATTATSLQGTLSYMATEQLRLQQQVKCNFETVAWAAASTVFEIFMVRDFWDIPSDGDPTAYVWSCIQKNMEPATYVKSLEKYPKIMKRIIFIISK